MGKLTKLKTFNVSHTAITALPSQLWSLKSIEVLDLSHCKLKKLDDGIGNYLQLNMLNISNNQIKVLPGLRIIHSRFNRQIIVDSIKNPNLKTRYQNA